MPIPEDPRILAQQQALLKKIEQLECELADKSPIPAAASECGLFLDYYAMFLKHINQMAEAEEMIRRAIQYHEQALRGGKDNRLFQERLDVSRQHLDAVMHSMPSAGA